MVQPNRQYPVRRLRPRERQEIEDLARLHGGLTLAEVRGLARQKGTAAKAVHDLILQRGLPILPDRKPKRGPASPPKDRGPASPPKLQSDGQDELKAALADARAQRAEADREIAKARRAVQQTAELRRATEADRERLEQAEEEVAILKTALALPEDERPQAVEIAATLEFLPGDTLKPLLVALHQEIERREAGGRRKSLRLLRRGKPKTAQ